MSEKILNRIARSAPSKHRPRLKSERTREAILTAALEFTWDHDFNDLTVRELMARAGCSRAAFYQYFSSLHQLMETLLLGLKQEIFDAAGPWFQGEGDPKPLLVKTLEGLVHICHELGPVLRAVADAKSGDARLAKTWADFLGAFDDAVTTHIEHHQAQGLIPAFDARPVAVALNRMDAAYLIHAFGRRPCTKKKPVTDALVRIWLSTLYDAA